MLPSALIAKLNRQKAKDETLTKKVSVKTQKSKLKPKKGLVSPVVRDSFDEEIRELGTKFRVEPSQVKQGLQGVITFTTENPKMKNKLFDDDNFPIFLQINSIKVPKGHPRIVRIPLKHSTLTTDSEVCLIVADVKGIANKKHEEHLEHYEKLLRQKGVDSIKKIMTFHEFRTEYETFELKSKLVELYDAFLVDGKVNGKTVKKCGKIFYKRRKVPTAVKLNASRLKEHIEQILRKTPLYLHTKGDSFSVQIGHSKMGLEEMVENTFYVIKTLEKEFPGGFGNVRSLYLYAFRGLTIPIYTTLKNQNLVDGNKNVKKGKPIETFSGELTTRLNSGVVVKSTGDVSVYHLKNNNNDVNQDGQDSQIVSQIKNIEANNKRESREKRKRKIDETNLSEGKKAQEKKKVDVKHRSINKK